MNELFHNMNEGTDEIRVYMKKDSRSPGRHSGPPNFKRFLGLTEIIQYF